MAFLARDRILRAVSPRPGVSSSRGMQFTRVKAKAERVAIMLNSFIAGICRSKRRHLTVGLRLQAVLYRICRQIRGQEFSCIGLLHMVGNNGEGR